MGAVYFSRSIDMFPKMSLRALTSSSILIPLLLLHDIQSTCAQICYDTDGSVVIGDLACHPHLKNSFCCGASWTCMGPGICSRENTTEATTSGGSPLQRASCTDPTWASDACPNFCLKDKNSTSTSPTFHSDWAIPVR